MVQISVIMSVYNTQESFLREAIESILGQTFSNFEFLIIDDGSTLEHVSQTIKSYQDARIRYVYQDNKGVAAARNVALKLAVGEYIAIMDSDDIALPERFEKQANYLRDHPDVSVCGAWFEIFPEVQVIRHPTHVCVLDLLRYCCVGHSTAMWKRADLDKFGLSFYDVTYQVSEDYELWSRIVRHLRIDNIPEVLVKYRQHQGNITKNADRLHYYDTQIHQRILAWLTEDPMLQSRLLNLASTRREKYKFYPLGFPVLKIIIENDELFVYLFGFIRICRFKRV